MRWRAGRNEANLRQPDTIGEFFGQAQMGEMDGVEGPAQHADGACGSQLPLNSAPEGVPIFDHKKWTVNGNNAWF